MSTLTITQIEKIEFDLVAALAKLPAGARQMRTKALEVLAKVRVRKRELLAQSPDVLRKASAATPAAPHWFGLPSAEPEVTEMVRQYRDRQSEERRLSKASGRTRYQAPKHLHGRSMHLADGRQLNIPAHGFCELADCGAHPASPHAQSARHAELVAAGFRVMPDEPDETLKRTLREQPIVGDRGLINFLNRNARG